MEQNIKKELPVKYRIRMAYNYNGYVARVGNKYQLVYSLSMAYSYDTKEEAEQIAMSAEKELNEKLVVESFKPLSGERYRTILSRSEGAKWSKKEIEIFAEEWDLETESEGEIIRIISKDRDGRVYLILSKNEDNSYMLTSNLL